jgi:hypothetical protein
VPGINARKFAAGMLSMIEGGIMLAGTTKKNRDMELVMDAVADLVNGICV